MIYKFKAESSFSGDAKSIYQELERIREEKDDKLRPADIVQEAKDLTNPLHPYFEWSDTIAAHKYRKGTARRLVKSIIIISEEKDNEKIIPAYINVKTEDKEQYYQSIETASLDEFESAIYSFKQKVFQLMNSLTQIEQAASNTYQAEKVKELRKRTEDLKATL